MKNKKILTLFIMILAVLIFSAGCMKKVNEKIGTKIGEKILEKALGDDVKIDSKDKKLSISTKDGDLQMGESLDWPNDKMKPLPKPKAKVVSVGEQSSDQSITVMVHFPNHTEPMNYLEEVKSLGFMQESMSESEGFYSFMGYGKDNIQLSITTMGLDELAMGIITLTRDSDYAEEFFRKEEEGTTELDLTGVDMTDDVPWPKDKMDDIPELPGKIVAVTTMEDAVYIELEYVKKEDVITYIETVRKLGFSISSSETVSSDYILYMSLNEKDYNLTINWYGNGANISYSK